jgi:hypothetical protein
MENTNNSDLLFTFDYLLNCPYYMEHHKRVLQNIQKHLYHYTNPDGFFGIFNSLNLRATDFRSLTDTEEILHTYKILNMILTDGNMKDQLAPEIQQVAPALVQLVNNWISEKPTHFENIFFTSFSVAGDDLNQWRAYCPTGGYSIGFPLSVVHNAISKLQQIVYSKIQLKVALLPCIYEDTLKIKMISHVLHNCFRNNVNCKPSNFPAIFYSSFKIFTFLFKHESFASENEFRIILEAFPADINDYTSICQFLNYRISRNKITSYLEVPLTFDSLPVQEDSDNYIDIKISPNIFNAHNMNNCRMFINAKTGRNAVIRKSNSPYTFT